MKYLRLALIGFVSVLSVVRAQDEERRAPPVEIPDFSNLDEYIYEPKSTVKLGFRHLSGPKAKFSGQGTIAAPEAVLPTEGGPTVGRYYHDGSVLPDTRTTQRLDDSGNPVIDPATGTTATDPLPPDGKTNQWSYTDARQVDQDAAGYISFHQYSAQVTDTATRSAKGRSTNGLDLTVSRDMGTLFGTKITWALMGGMSVNDISARKIDRVNADLTTITDVYFLNGQAAPTAPYSTIGAVPTTQTITNSDGTTSTVYVDTTVLIGKEPAGQGKSDKALVGADDTATEYVTNNWKVKGAYYTFRGGAELWLPITARFRAGVSLGAALAYAGTSYTVVQTLTPEIGTDITATETNSVYKLLPGYYADATLQFDLTEKAGFFAGAVFQSTGSYTQAINSTTAQYKTKVDLSNQNGIRAGMSIRF